MPGRTAGANIAARDEVRPGTRRAIAYVAGRVCTGSDARGILDLETGEHASFEGTVGEEIALYDHSRNCHVGGTASQLFDGGDRQWINLVTSEDFFTGFDHESNHHFGGRARGQDVWVFDGDAGRRFSYVLADPTGSSMRPDPSDDTPADRRSA